LVLMTEACCSVLPEQWRPTGEASVALRLRRVDDQSDERPYLQRVRYWVSFSCVETEEALAHPYREGVIERGELELYPPLSCTKPASLELELWPDNLLRCDSAHIGPIDMTAPQFDGTLTIRLRCDSEIRSAKLYAVSILQCHEHATAIARAGEHAFRAEGCGRSLMLHCDGDPFGDDYMCEGAANAPQ
jgi:hypothetical protein